MPGEKSQLGRAAGPHLTYVIVRRIAASLLASSALVGSGAAWADCTPQAASNIIAACTGNTTASGAVGSTAVASGGIFAPGLGTPGSSNAVSGNLALHCHSPTSRAPP
jgi:hypothetical protein